MRHCHEPKINESKARSILKTITGRLIEIGVGTLVQGRILSYLGFENAFELGFIMTLIEEVVCFCICLVNERIWNRINWGRNVIWDKIDWGREIVDIENTN